MPTYVSYGGATFSASAAITPASNAFDSSVSSAWTAGPPAWLQIQLASAVVLSSYRIQAGLATASSASSPAAWTMQGSNNGSTWTTIDTQAGQISSAWLTQGGYYVQDFPAASGVAYLFYRWNFSAANGAAFVAINTIYLYLGTQIITFPAIPAHLTTDGPITLGATASSGLPVSYSVSGPATISAGVLTLTGSAGVVTVIASQAGNSTYPAAISVTRSFTVSAPPAAQTITFPALADQITTASPVHLLATASSGLAVSYSITGPGILVIVSGAYYVQLTGSIGTVSVTASQPGSGAWLAATPLVRTFNVTAAPAANVITFAAIPDKLTTDPMFGLVASASSGLPVTFVVTSGPATVLGGIVTLTGGTGTVTITASQPGNGTYAAATPVSRTFLVSTPAAQTITFPVIPDHLNTDGSFTLLATASSGLPITYVVTSGPASVFGSSCILTGGLGSVTVTAYQPGDSTHAAATPVSRTFNVLAPALVPQTITFPPLPDRLASAIFTLAATASSGLAVTYTISGPATLSGSIVTVTGTGSITITAFQAGDSTWAAAVPVARTFNGVAPVDKYQRGNIAYNQIRAAHRQGSGGTVQMYSGAPPASGNVPVWDPNGSLVDSGVSAVAGGSSGSGNAAVFGETPLGTIGSSNTVFTLAFTPLNAAVDLFLNGVAQRPTVDFLLAGSTITYTVPPRTGDVHTASYRR
jgi:hypothetical protein